jgi:hypothetical protein
MRFGQFWSRMNRHIMQLEVIGPHPCQRGEPQVQATRIGTLFPEYGVLITQTPGIHALQRLSFIDWLNEQRSKQGLRPLTSEEEEEVSASSVDLIFEPDHILIRPDPERMDLACAADELLQVMVSKRQIKFLSVSDRRVRDALRQRGEYWRLSSLPKTREGKERLVSSSKVAIGGRPIYYFNRITGTRWLTFHEFENLGALSDAELAKHLQEIADNSMLRNRFGRPEVDFFAADPRRFGARELAGFVYAQLSGEPLRAKFEQLKEQFRCAVHDSLRKDNFQDKTWCERVISSLFLEGNEAETEQILSGLSPEFFMRVEWLPGGRFEEGEFLFDSLFDEAASHPEDGDLQRLCDPRSKGIIFNLIREYGDLEYVNVGSVPESLSLDRPQKEGRRGVYLVEFRSRSTQTSLKRFIRLQKWGVWEHLNEGKDLLQSIKESDDYTDYWLDRRLGCRQLGMNLTRRVVMRRLSETYAGTNPRYRGEIIRTVYFERDYLPGIATDKLPVERYSRPGYAPRLATLLGRVAASSMIVGRSFDLGISPLFDDGDEVVSEGEDGLPTEVLLGDHSGAFGEYKSPLDRFAAYYARPVNKRENLVPNPEQFAMAYLTAFREQFHHIQGDYRKRRRAFDTLFKHCKYDTGGSFAYRWECVLKRLDQTDAESILSAIRKHIRVLSRTQSPAPAAATAATLI